MAYSQIGAVPTKLSFAKIAAMPAPNIMPALPNNFKDNKIKTPPSDTQIKSPTTANEPAVNSLPLKQDIRSQFVPEVENMRSNLENLSLGEQPPLQAQALQHTESVRDDQSQLSNTSSKQQSFDTKSMASVTTFAMDEKESIRPDDSASVRAAEDEDSQPGISRASSFQHDTDQSSAGQRIVHRHIAPNVTIAARRYAGSTLTNPPRFGDLPLSSEADLTHSRPDSCESPASAPDSGRERSSSIAVSPDEKLLEALSSPKDRLPLLQLEEKFITFIEHGRDDILELPPQNSFTRLLTHKLADYYALAHQVTEDNSSVRIFRTTCCTLPMPLAEIAKSIGTQQVSVAAQVKIMRRAQLGRQFSAATSTAPSSSVPSMTTSENGGDFNNSEEGLQSPLEGTPGRDKPKSREEREAQYKAVRERIFGDFQESITSESGSAGETSASMSRSSSTSGSKRKARKHKTPKDDSFTRRSEYIAYGPMHMQQHLQPTFTDVSASEGYQMHTGMYPQAMPNTNQMLQYQNYDLNVGYYGTNVCTTSNGQPYNSGNWQGMQQAQNNPAYNVQPMQNFSQTPHIHPQMRTSFTQPIPTMPASPNWMQTQFPNAYPPVTANTGSDQWQNNYASVGVPSQNYPFLPTPQQSYGIGAPYGAQNQIMANFSGSRSLFNPQTRSFVPNNASGRAGNRNPRKKPGQGVSNGKESDIAGAENSTQVLRSDNDSSRLREDSLQQKYGTPANLPKKPPPSQVSPHFTGDTSTNSNLTSGKTNGTTPMIVSSNRKRDPAS